MKIIAASTTEHSLGKNNAETLKKKKKYIFINKHFHRSHDDNP